MAIVKIDGIPVYDARIGEDGGMLRISLVDAPAVMSDFVAFAEQKPVQMYRIEDEMERRVLGVVMRADFPIYRRDDKLGEYYIIYRANTIRDMAQRYLAEGRQNDVNLMHAGADVEGVEMVQFFVKGKGLQPEGFEDIADGSLFAEFHVTDDGIWEDIKEGTYKGFSLEGVFDLEPEQDKDDVQDIVDRLGGKFTQTLKNTNMKVKKFFEALEAALVAVKMGSITTDKGVLSWDGEEDLKEGDRVFLEDEEGERRDAEDGQYRTPDGKVIDVVEGKVASIEDEAAEVAPQEGDPEAEVAPQEEFKARIQKMEASYDEIYRHIYEAISATGVEDFYVAEAGENYAVIVSWDGEGEKYFRYELETAEDGTVTLVGEPVEVKPMFVPVDFVSPFEKGASEEELRKENESLREQLKAMRKKAAAKPAHEEFQSIVRVEKTGSKGMDRIARLMAK